MNTCRRVRSEHHAPLLWIPFAVLACTSNVDDSQVASTVEPARTGDASYMPDMPRPAHPQGDGPVICVDETHNNFHTLEGTYGPFGRVLTRDGYVLRRFTRRTGELDACEIFVIADAQPPASVDDAPTFSPEDVTALNAWVRDGGSLFLITDHQPDPGAIETLASSFGVQVLNGYVPNGHPDDSRGPIIFRAEDGSLRDDPLIRGERTEEAVGQVATFLGSALRGGEDFRPLLILGSGSVSWAPARNYDFRPDSPTTDVAGWSQGGVLEFGDGRIAVFGEAAMFTAQVFDGGTTRFGMSAPEARDNLQLLLNVIHWLSRLEPEAIE